MSSRSVRTERERVARSTLGESQHRRPARAPSRTCILHPEQLPGTRARTCIRQGAVMQRSDGMDDGVVIGIDVSKAELSIAVHPSGETWTSATTPAAIERQ